jgi:hypothetical protein
LIAAVGAADYAILQGHLRPRRPTETDDARQRLEMRALAQSGHLSAFAGMTPVAIATATAWVRFMQLSLCRAVSR